MWHIAIYVSNSINAYPIHYPVPFHEQMWLQIPLVGNDLLMVGCIYRSPSSDTLSSTNLLCSLLTSAVLSCTHLLVCVDFNYASINWATGYGHTTKSYAQQFLDTPQDQFLYQHVTLPTRYRHGQLSNTLDLVKTNKEHMIDDITFTTACP